MAFEAGSKKYNFSVGRKLGSGGYGDIHLGMNNYIYDARYSQANALLGTDDTTGGEVALKLV